MENKIISIDISPDSDVSINENGGVMWEHNATTLIFNIDARYVGDYRYYIEYRSLIGTKIRTEYLTLNEDNTVKYVIPVNMSSLKGVECYFNIIKIDADGNTTQVIKPRKFCLSFDFSPDTDNSLSKVNDFSINALLEAIRLGTFKGESGKNGEKGEKGDKGDKGEKGDTGEVSLSYANSNYSNALKGEKNGSAILINDASPFEHKASVSLATKNIWNGSSSLTTESYNYTQTVNITKPITISFKVSDDYATSSSIWRFAVVYADGTAQHIQDRNLTASTYSKVFSATEENPIISITSRSYSITAGSCYDIQVEFGEFATEYAPNISGFSDVSLKKIGKNLWKFGDVTVADRYQTIILDTPLPSNVTYTLTADVESTDTDSDTCLVFSLTAGKPLGQITRGGKQSITFTPDMAVSKIVFYSANNSNSGTGDSAEFKNIQIEIGEKPTQCDQYIEYGTIDITENGNTEINVVDGGEYSLLPTNSGVTLTCQYPKDINKVFKIICEKLGIEL